MVGCAAQASGEGVLGDLPIGGCSDLGFTLAHIRNRRCNQVFFDVLHF